MCFPFGEGIPTCSALTTGLISHPLVCICLLTRAAKALAKYFLGIDSNLHNVFSTVGQHDFCGMSRPSIFLPFGQIWRCTIGSANESGLPLVALGSWRGENQASATYVEHCTRDAVSCSDLLQKSFHTWSSSCHRSQHLFQLTVADILWDLSTSRQAKQIC